MTWLDDQHERVEALETRVSHEQAILGMLTDIAEWAHRFEAGCVGDNDVPPVHYGDRPEPGYCKCTVSPWEATQANTHKIALTSITGSGQGVDPDILVTARTVLNLLSHWKAGTLRADLRCEKDEIMAVLG